MAVDDLMQQALAALDQLAIEHGDSVARHAAAVLRKSRRGGRPENDDDAALAEVQKFISAGRNPVAALDVVVRRHAVGREGRRNLKKRLRRKFGATTGYGTASQG